MFRRQTQPRRHKNGAMPCKASVLLSVFIGILLLAGCTAQFPLNPKTSAPPQRGPADPVLAKIIARDRSPSLLFFLTFSGGGSRAAALSYGVLEALERIEMPPDPLQTDANRGRHTLLDEVDLISSVSGGSFTAAYYGLHGKSIFKDYRENFLTQDYQSALLWRLFNPINWFAIGSPFYGRSDLAAEYYDANLFHGATLGDLARGDGPAVLIMATDVADGFIFSFSPGLFSLLCSDYDQFPVARAVAASAAFPGAFSPIALKNYAGQCRSAEHPEWMRKALEKPDMASRVYYNAVRLNTYMNPQTKPYIYLVDGGVSDNLGVRGPLEAMMIRGDARDLLKETGFDKTEKVVFLIVDAQTQETSSWRLLKEIPGLAMILDASSTIMVNKYNFETIELLHRYARDWTYLDKTKGIVPIEFYIIHVTFEALPDKDEREYFHKIPTSLRLSEDQIDRLRDAAGRILYADENFQRLVKSLGAKIPDTPARK